MTDEQQRQEEELSRPPSVPPGAGGIYRRSIHELVDQFESPAHLKQDFLRPLMSVAADKFGDHQGTKNLHAFSDFLDEGEQVPPKKSLSTSDDPCNHRGFAKAKEAAERYTPKASQTPKTPIQGSKLAARNFSPLDTDAVAPAGTPCNSDDPKSVANQSKKRKHRAEEEHEAVAEAEDGGEVGASPTARTPILDLLCDGIDITSLNKKAAIIRISTAIAGRAHEDESAVKSRINGGRNARRITWQGRCTAGTRYSFALANDGDTTTNFGLRATMSKVLDGKKKNVRSRCEVTLSKFVSWNPFLFPELGLDQKARTPIVPGPYESVIHILTTVDGLTLPTPLAHDEADEICSAIFEALATRFRNHVPDSNHLQHHPIPDMPKSTKKRILKKGRDISNWKLSEVPSDAKYSLVEPRNGDIQFNFRDLLKTCFRNKEGPRDAVEQGLEERLYGLAKLEKKAFPELFA